jgi:hypothetical protein
VNDTAAAVPLDAQPAPPPDSGPRSVRPARAVDVVGEVRAEAAYGCGPRVAPQADGLQGALPELPGPPLVALLVRAEAERDGLKARSDTLRSELTTVREKLEATEKELERIRKTLKP